MTLRTTGELHERAGAAARRLSLPAAAVAAAFLIWTVVVAVDHNDKNVFPPLLPALLGIVALVLAAAFVFRGRVAWSFIATAVGTVAAVATLFTSLYPRVMVSNPNFANSLTIDGASSSHYALAVMTVVALVFTPIVLLYQGWTYYVFRRRVGGQPLSSPPDDSGAPPEVEPVACCRASSSV